MHTVGTVLYLNLHFAVRTAISRLWTANSQPSKEHQREATIALACHSWSFPDDGGDHYRAKSGSMNNF